LIVVGEGTILSATKNGYGKRTQPDDYPTKGRGGMGVIDIKTTERNGPVIGAVQVGDDDEIMLITDGGTLVRTAVDGVSTVGRNTQGVRLIRLDKGESLVEIARIDESDVNGDDVDDSDSDATDAGEVAATGGEDAADIASDSSTDSSQTDDLPGAQQGDMNGEDDDDQSTGQSGGEQDNPDQEV
jgi:DNA gyrase subunit A